MATPCDTTPPHPLAGDPPAATHSTPPLSGDPPAATCGAGCALEGRPHSGSGGSSSFDSRDEIRKKSDLEARKDSRGNGPALGPVEVTGWSELRPGATYKEALVGVRTFKPRSDMSKQPGEWNDNSLRRRPARSVWDRLGPWPGAIHERLGARVPLGQQDINGFLQILKTKAVGRCYNCLASDHRIASCRDPPKCILCSRSGHKARRCPGRAPAAVWRCRAPVVDAAAPRLCV